MRALVTGGTGFVGAAVVRHLVGQGDEVVCLLRPTSPVDNLAGLDVALVHGDLTDRASLERALAGCQALYHVAALYSTRPDDATRMWDVNVEGTRDLLTLAAEMGLQRIVHTSTIGTIGRPVEDRLPTEEDWFDDLESASPYARSKIAGERVALDLARRGAPVVVVNPCAPVGAGDIKPSSTGQRIIDYLQGRMPSFTAGGINFVSVEDVAQGHLLAAERGRAGQRYILGNATGNLLLTDFLHLMEQATGIARPGRRTMAGRVRGLARRILGRRAPAVAHPASGYRPPALTADPSLAIEELGLPQTPLEVAICQAMAWFREHGYVKGAAR